MEPQGESTAMATSTTHAVVLWIMAMLAMDINGSYYSKQTVFCSLISFLDSFDFLVK
jgi:hypothetical protein